MKKFRFEYSKLIWILLSLVLVLVAIGITWNIFNLIEYSFLGTFKIVSYSLIVALLTLLLVIVISVMLCSKYVVKDGFVHSYIGIFKNKTDVKDISCFVLFKKSNKLVVYYKDNKYSVVLLSPNDYDDFVLAVREFNHEIAFRTEIDGEETPQ